MQTPHERRLPQPSPAGPQVIDCAAHEVGLHAAASGYPHWPDTPPPPQVCGETQFPQAIWLPQPSPAGPQVIPCAAHVWAWQPPPSGKPQCPKTPPPPHV
jgi:hypothetical protein